ncbi:hypothetical protein BCF46_0667 [Litoreibacter meonggei]|uniref:Uncharacterized protein n=1 Tax=Litoreibacter meonggei TaxID=1049199 RepID=A0A497X5B4_9RHOB|nr:hypothetical protein [Litoreibacter meonggei]RLJ60466.1 hypothetical protein BCF46_0667 [Litoreibacter meonggei]
MTPTKQTHWTLELFCLPILIGLAVTIGLFLSETISQFILAASAPILLGYFWLIKIRFLPFWLKRVAFLMPVLPVVGSFLLDTYGTKSEDYALMMLVAALVLMLGFLSIRTVSSLSVSQGNFVADYGWISRSTDNATVENAARQLLYESNATKKTSFWALFGVGCIIFLAVNVILFAGIITNIDLRSADRESNAASYLRDIQVENSNRKQALKDIDLQIARLQVQFNFGRDRQQETFEFKEIERQISGLTLEKEELIERSNVSKRRLTDAEDLLDQIKRDQLLLLGSTTSSTEAREALIASAVTRFGVIAVLLFFAQALITLYRYSLRLSNSYQSKAISLVLADAKVGEIEQLVKIFSSDTVMFGKETGLQLDQLEKITDLIAKLKP